MYHNRRQGLQPLLGLFVHNFSDLFFKVVKTAFNQRRKTIRNSLKIFDLSDKLREDVIFAQRPEQLSVQQFIELTKSIEKDGFRNK